MDNIWEDNPAIKNLELGAGCGRFGEKFYPPCYISDAELYPCGGIFCSIPVETVCIDLTIKVPQDLSIWSDARFEKIILPNPYNYGFKDEEGNFLLSELLRILRQDGEIIIISNITNPFADPKKIQKIITQLESTQMRSSKIIMNVSTINAIDLYRGHTFYASGRLTKAYPNQQITIKNDTIRKT